MTSEGWEERLAVWEKYEPKWVEQIMASKAVAASTRMAHECVKGLLALGFGLSTGNSNVVHSMMLPVGKVAAAGGGWRWAAVSTLKVQKEGGKKPK